MKKEERYEIINGKKVLVEVYPSEKELKKMKPKKKPKKKQDTRMQNDDFFDWNDSATYC